MSPWADVAVTLPVDGSFSYSIPEHLQSKLQRGHRVMVPFGRRTVTGFILETHEESPETEVALKPIIAVLDDEPLLTPDVMELAGFAASYYLAPLGAVLKVACPPGLSAGSVLRLKATAEGHRVLADPFGDLDKKERQLLEAATKGAGVRGASAKSTAAGRLQARGLAALKNEVAQKSNEDEVELFSRAMSPKEAWPHLERAPARRELWALLEDKEVSREALRDALGSSASRILRDLQKRNLVSVRRVPQEETTAINWEPEQPPKLTEEQSAALAEILPSVDNSEAQAYLLQGVTGSGKTEVYLRVIEAALNQDKSAIVLLPEIALTPQLESRFVARFGPQVAVLHSALPDHVRRRQWRRLREGRARIALGPRSALWAPTVNLGVIVVDEEHDGSFKQNSDVRYHGRDLALVRAKNQGAVCVLGSATPSLETYHLAKTGKVEHLYLNRRVADRPLPKVERVSLVDERRQRGRAVELLSTPMQDALREVVERKEQAILFLNRRGFNTVVYCEDCGAPRSCPNCSVSLTHHLKRRQLKCHHCEFQESFDAACRECGGKASLPLGAGTERVEAAVRTEVPDARVLRLDRDVTSKAGALDNTLTAFREHEADVLVGTQMVAKGHDFPRVTLVGLVLADASLSIPDFRAAERTFQLVVQVAGRAGRADVPGRVIVQAFEPEHRALKLAANHEVSEFLAWAYEERLADGYPPHRRLGAVRVDAPNRADAQKWAEEARRALQPHVERLGLRLLGPAPAPMERIRGRDRFLLLVFADRPSQVVTALGWVQRALQSRPNSVSLVVDVDPVDLL